MEEKMNRRELIDLIYVIDSKQFQLEKNKYLSSLQYVNREALEIRKLKLQLIEKINFVFDELNEVKRNLSQKENELNKIYEEEYNKRWND